LCNFTIKDYGLGLGSPGKEEVTRVVCASLRGLKAIDHSRKQDVQGAIQTIAGQLENKVRLFCQKSK
jgi:hypothetical protein